MIVSQAIQNQTKLPEKWLDKNVLFRKKKKSVTILGIVTKAPFGRLEKLNEKYNKK